MNSIGGNRICLIRNTFLVLALLACMAALGCSSAAQNTGGLPDRNPEVAYRLVNEEGALLLDVRTPGEFLSSRLPGAKNVPIEQLPQRLSEIEQYLEGNKEKPIVVYCAAGARAARAKQILLNSGFPNVSNLGGISDWPKGK